MELVGIADVASDDRIRVAVERGYAVFASDLAARDEVDTAGVPVTGTLDDLLGQVDVVADGAPKKLAAANKDRYQAADVKGIWQGGEKHELADYSVCVPGELRRCPGDDEAQRARHRRRPPIRVSQPCGLRTPASPKSVSWAPRTSPRRPPDRRPAP